MSLKIKKRRWQPASVFKASTVFGASFAFSFAVGSLSFIPQESTADSYVDADVDPSIAIMIDTDSLDMLLISNRENIKQDLDITNNIDVVVDTNNANGYSLTMSIRGSSTGLAHSNGTNAIPSTTNQTPADLAVNTWGFNIGRNATTFKRLPGLGADTTINTTNKPNSASSTTITLGIKADPTLPTGSYSGTLKFAVVPN